VTATTQAIGGRIVFLFLQSALGLCVLVNGEPHGPVFVAIGSGVVVVALFQFVTEGQA
jgi:hypothetical protein